MSQTSPQKRVVRESLDRSLYVIGHAGHGLVKIGIADCPSCRLRTLQSWSDKTLIPELVERETLELLHHEPGDRLLEQRLHRYFRHRRVVGEWFDLGPVAVSLIKSVLRDVRNSA